MWPDHVKLRRSAGDDIERFKKHVFPVVGDVGLKSFTVAHAEAVLRAMPGSLFPATRRQVAQLLHRVLTLAVYPAQLIAANPLPRGFLPHLGPPKPCSTSTRMRTRFS
jgi:hypothetical protein